MALDYTIIGERIKLARTKKKLTQEKLAERLDVSVPYLSRVECGDASINLKRLSQICELLRSY
ncbi:MAG: helix-turn-helix transcriptional regulator [Clostridia bacterium]|nr:helix-turn-helix transcriptional regulator [Clostridia bacterium]